MDVSHRSNSLANLRDFILPQRIYIPIELLQKLAEEVMKVEKILDPNSLCTPTELIQEHYRAAHILNIKENRLIEPNLIDHILQLSELIRKGEWDILSSSTVEGTNYKSADIKSYSCHLQYEVGTRTDYATVKAWAGYLVNRKYVTEVNEGSLNIASSRHPDVTFKFYPSKISEESSLSYLPYRLIRVVTNLASLQMSSLEYLYHRSNLYYNYRSHDLKYEHERSFEEQAFNFLENSKTYCCDYEIDKWSKRLEMLKSKNLSGLLDFSPEALKNLEDKLLVNLTEAHCRKNVEVTIKEKVDISSLHFFINLSALQEKAYEQYRTRVVYVEDKSKYTTNHFGSKFYDSSPYLPDNVRREIDEQIQDLLSRKNKILSDQSNGVATFKKEYSSLVERLIDEKLKR